MEAERLRQERREHMLFGSKYLTLYLVYLLHEEAKVTICIYIIVPIYPAHAVLYTYIIVYYIIVSGLILHV